MSAQEIERELEEFLAHSDYEVRFENAMSYGWFYVRVFYRDTVIYEKGCLKSYPWAARRAKRQVVRHAKALVILGGLVMPEVPVRTGVSA